MRSGKSILKKQKLGFKLELVSLKKLSCLFWAECGYKDLEK